MRYFYIIIILSLSFGSFSQRMKIKDSQLIYFEIPPKNAQYLGFSNIYVEPKLPADYNYRTLVSDMIYKGKYTVVNDRTQANLIVSFITSNNILSFPKDRVETKNDKTKYYTESKHKLDCTFFLSLPSGQIVDQVFKTIDIDVEGNSPKTQEAATKEYNNRVARDIPSKISSLVTDCFDDLQDKYFIVNETLSAKIFEFKHRRHTYEEFDAAADLLLQWLKTNPGDLSSPNIQEAISIFEEFMREYSKKKRARVNPEVAAAVEYQLALIYFQIKDYTNANLHIQNSETYDKRLNNHQQILNNYCKIMVGRNGF